jgi:hypothetical protein
MTRTKTTVERPLTLAEICEAITAGHVVAEMEDGHYNVRMRDLVRLARQQPMLDKTQQMRPVRLAS